jgi:hypothetical protein
LALAIVATLCLLLVFLPNEPWTVELRLQRLLRCSCGTLPVSGRPSRPSQHSCVRSRSCGRRYSPSAFSATHGCRSRSAFLSAQATILATSFGALVLAALFSERRTHERAILERERRLEEALRAGG